MLIHFGNGPEFDLFPNLHTFRITGGEPLLSRDTFKVLDYIIENPSVNPMIEISVNSNLWPHKIYLTSLLIRSIHYQERFGVELFIIHKY